MTIILLGVVLAEIAGIAAIIWIATRNQAQDDTHQSPNPPVRMPRDR